MFSGGWSLVSAASRAVVFAAVVVMVIALDVPEPVGVDGSFPYFDVELAQQKNPTN